MLRVVATAALLLHPAFRLLGVLVLIQVDHRDVGAFAGVHDPHGAADPAIATGDDCLFAC